MKQMGYGESALKVNQRDIVLIKFPFSDLSGAKVRPALVISNQGYNIKSLDTVVLALECSELREAERLIDRALAGNPPADIADKLRDLLLEEVYSQRQPRKFIFMKINDYLIFA
jgi:PemK-like, MazF-like toxin of type II toxin-antitoxin system